MVYSFMSLTRLVLPTPCEVREREGKERGRRGRREGEGKEREGEKFCTGLTNGHNFEYFRGSMLSHQHFNAR
jgi:hypothetical protein